MRRSVLAASALVIIMLFSLLLLALPVGNTIPYTVTGKSGEIEFRHYPALVLATTDSPGSDAGFNLLFAYISGKNKANDTVSMTVPVISQQKIPMTAPVISDSGTMSFVMPAGKTRDQVPDPLDPQVRIETVPERDIAVIRFSGYASQNDVDAASSRLQNGLANASIKIAGTPFLMRYNPPWTPGFLRRNEVGIEIQG
jgi:hypothetical protein